MSIASSPSVATIDKAVKRYGRVPALDGLCLSVEASEVIAILGPNGAGKTTLFRVLLGLEDLDGGTVSLFGGACSPGTRQARRRMGYAPEVPPVELKRTGLENVVTFALLMGVDEDLAWRSSLRRLAEVGLEGEMHRPVKGYSKGMRQRMSLARATAHDPDLILLDEPGSGLDPSGREDIRRRVGTLKEQGRTVLLATHDVQDAAGVADRIVIIREGCILWTGPAVSSEALTARYEEVMEDASQPVSFLPAGN